jgi:hypothetical protein
MHPSRSVPLFTSSNDTYKVKEYLSLLAILLYTIAISLQESDNGMTGFQRFRLIMLLVTLILYMAAMANLALAIVDGASPSYAILYILFGIGLVLLLGRNLIREVQPPRAGARRPTSLSSSDRAIVWIISAGLLAGTLIPLGLIYFLRDVLSRNTVLLIAINVSIVFLIATNAYLIYRLRRR